MRFGFMDRKITIQSVTESQSSSGAVTETWADLADVWAQVLPVRGSESFAEGRDLALKTRQFVMRYRDDLTTKHRLVHESNNYDIELIEEIGRHEGLTVTARLVEA